MRFRSVACDLFRLALVILTLAAGSHAFANEQSSDIPGWLAAHVGEGPGEIARPVLERARALYMQKVADGTVRNPCYFAMDATRPNDSSDGKYGGRFYVVCEADHSFTAIAAGHGSGRNLGGMADFANGRFCARNFGNAMDSDLTTGGVYVTSETKTSFKGYYRGAGGTTAALFRSFIQFDGEGETANARARAIGGHSAVSLKKVCLWKDPSSPYANHDGYVPFGDRVDYTGGRSNGCTSWSPSDVEQISAMIKNDPTSLYIYPEASDIEAVDRAVAGGRPLARSGLYWNAACLKDIRAPKYWSKAMLEPIIERFKAEHPAPPPRPTPICTGQ